MRHSSSTIAGVLIAVTLIAASVGAVIVPHWLSLPHFTTFDGGRYHFRATDSGGSILPDGPYSMVFAIWDDETAGTMLWSEIQTVSIADGLGAVQLGEVTPIPLDVFGTLGGDTLSARYLEITLAGEVISPRTRLVSVPYANASERVLGDIETSDGHLRVSNIGSSGVDGVSIDLDALEDVGKVSIGPVGSAGTDGAFIIIDPDSSSLELKNDFSYTTSKFTASLTGGSLGVKVKKSNFKSAEINVVPDADVEIKGSSLSPGGDLTGFSYNANENNALMSLSSTGSSSQSGHNAVAELDSIIQSSWHIGPSSTDSSNTVVGSGSVRHSASSTDGVSITKVLDMTSPGLHESVCTGEHLPSAKLTVRRAGTGTEYTNAHYYCVDPAAGDSVGATSGASTDSSYWSAYNISSSGESGASVKVRDDSITIDLHSFGSILKDSSYVRIGGGSVERRTHSGSDISVVKVLDKTSTGLHKMLCTGEHNGLGKLSWYSHYTSPGEVYQKFYQIDLSSSDSIGLSGSFDTTGGSWRVSRTSSGNESGVVIDILQTDTTTFRVGRITPTPVVRGFQTSVTEGGSTNAEFSDPGGSGGGGRVVIDCDASDASSSVTTIGAPAGDGVVSTATGSIASQSVRVGGGAGGSIWLQAENVPQGGKIGVNNNSPVFEVDVVGSICATGGIGCPSDKRLKKNIRELTDALSIVARLRGVTFDWRTDEFPDKNLSDRTEVGLIAQEVRKVIPEAVVEGSDGYLAVDYGRLTPVLLQAVKQQQATISQLESKVSKVDQLAAQVADLSAKLERFIAEKDAQETMASAPSK